MTYQRRVPSSDKPLVWLHGEIKTPPLSITIDTLGASRVARDRGRRAAHDRTLSRPVRQGRGKILVIRGGAIGDFILTLPVFAALRRQFPGTHLEVLGYPHIARLAAAGRLVDAVCSIEARALAGFFARGSQLDERLADYFAGFALIISFLFDPDGIFQENVTRCSKAPFIEGPHRPDEKLNLHATEAMLKPLERL